MTDSAGRLLTALAVFAVLMTMGAVASVAGAEVVAGTAAVGAGAQRPPMELPGAAISSSHRVPGASAGRWIIGAEPGAAATRIAAEHDAVAVSTAAGIYAVGRDDARSMARDLRRSGSLVYAEPDVHVRRADYPSDQFTPEQWWLPAIVNTAGFTPPAVRRDSPQMGLLEESVDTSHPEIRESGLTGGVSFGAGQDEHGTAVASVAGAPANGIGIVGTWPGMRMRLFQIGKTCSSTTRAIFKAVKSHVSTINMSYVFPGDSCFSHLVATQTAVKAGIIPVAAAGNDFAKGNPIERPADDPHVLTVAAVTDPSFNPPLNFGRSAPVSLQIADFSSRSPAVDLAAPGVNVAAAVPTEISASGYAYESGTSFSSPMVSAAATWLRQSRPGLSADQIATALTRSATDLGAKGRDVEYGWGLLDIGAALKQRVPSPDPREPNDDIEWVDGSRLKQPARFLWRHSKRRVRLNARLDASDDPADVYRIRLHPRQRISIAVKQRRGDVTLQAFRSKAKSIHEPGRSRIVRVDRTPPKRERVKIRNLARHSRTIYVALTISRSAKRNDASYRLVIKRNH